MKKWLDKYQSKGEVVNPNKSIQLKEVVIRPDTPTIKLQNQIFANNTRENVLDNRRNYYFPYETEQTKNIRNLADEQVFKSSGDLISAIHPVGAIINALYQGVDQTLPAEGLRYLPNKIPFKQARGYNRLIPILKPASRLIDPFQMFDKLRIADSLYNSADSIDLYNQFKNGGLISKNSLNRTVTCSNCGWSWKLSDGGKDPLTCHKCGGTIKMKHGGELDEYKEKGEVVNPNNPIQLSNVNFVYKKPVANSTFNAYQQNTPIVDRENFSNIPYRKSDQIAMERQNATNKRLAQQELQNELSAKKAKEKGTAFTLPTGVTKKYKDMNVKERSYVDAQVLKNKGRWNENQVEQPFLNNFNPITMLYDMGAGLGEAPLMSDVTNSYIPYVTGVVAPLTAGALAGIGANTTGQFVNELINPLAGIRNPFKNKNFKSEIDWENWVKYKEDFHNNPEVIKHLNDIEEATKANGTWMKNPDGSPFEGTPEQFVVQQSDNFKKMQGIINNEKNVPRINYHYSDKDFNIFDENFFKQGRFGKGIYTGLNPNLLNKSRIVRGNGLPPTDFTKRYSLYQRSTNPQTSYNDVYDKMAELHKNIQKIYNIPYGKKIYSNKLKNYIKEIDKLHNQSLGINPITKEFDREHAIHILKDNHTSLDINHPTDPNYEMVVPFSNYPKSAEGNILFDITNPDIYKAIVPAAIGVGALQENKYGGQWLDKYKDKGEVKSTFNPYANVNRVGSSDGTKVFRLNADQIEKAKKAAAIKNEKIVKEYQQNQRSFIGPDKRTKAERDKSIATRKAYDNLMEKQKVMKQQPIYQTLQNTTAGGYNPNAAYNPVIGQTAEGLGYMASGALGSSAVRPAFNFMGEAMNLPIQGVPGFTGHNIVNAAFATHGLKSIMDGSVTKPWQKAYRSGNPWDYANAVSENAMTALELAPLVGPGYRGALEAGKYLTENKALKNAYKKFKLPGSFNVASVTKNIEKSSFMPKSISELSNTGFRNDPNYHLNAFNDKKKNILENISTPEGRKRIQNYIDNNPHLKNNTVDGVIESFNKTEFVTETPKYDYTIDNGPNVPKGDWVRDASGNKIYFPVNPDNAFNWYINGYDEPSIISMGQNFTPYDAQHILEHEFAHLFQGGKEIKGVDDELANILLENFNPKSTLFNIDKLKKYNPFKKTYTDKGVSVTSDIYGYNNPSNIGLQNQKNYWNTGAGRGQEKAAFAAEVRENLLQRGLIKNRYDEITPELLKKHYDLYKNTIGDKYKLRLYDIMNKNPKNFKYLSTALNKLPGLIPYAIPTAVGVEALNQKQEGGAIITNRGQWDYPGQTTIIPSNEITMEGVPYPVLGVDNTGYVQMMQPQMNYTFPGQYVTEYPIMQYGGKLPKAQIGKQKGNPIFDWWYNLDDVQNTYKMAPDLDPFLKNWLKNPETQKRLKANLASSVLAYNQDPKKLINQAISKLDNLPMFSRELVKKSGISANDIRYNNELQGWKTPTFYGNNPYFTGTTNELGSYIPDYHVSILNNFFNDPGTITHEQTHATGPFQKTMEDVIFDKYYSKKNANERFASLYGEYKTDKNYNRVYDSFEKVKQKYPGFYKEWQEKEKYLNEDGMYPRIMDIRRTLNLKPGQKVDKSIFNNNSINLPVSDLKHYYDEDTIVDMLNTLAKNNQIKNLNTASHGGDLVKTVNDTGHTKMMKYGGLTKYQNKGEVKFNLYENVNRVGTSDNTKVFRLNPEQVEKAKKHLEETKKAKQYVINQTAKAKKFHTKWMHSPMYKEMLKNSAGINAKNINNARLNNLNNIKVSYNPAGMENRPTVSGASFPEAGDVEIYPKGVVDNVNNLGVHEFSHSIDRDPNDFFNRLIPNKDINKMKKYANKEYYNESLFDDLMYRKFGIIDPKRKPYKLKSEQQIFYEDNPEAFIYRIEPTETRARLNDIRQAGWETGAYDPFTEKVNKNIFNKLDEEKFYLENNRNWSPLMQLQEIYTNDQIIDLLNTVSKNNNNLNPQIINNNSDWEIIG
jgi:hypothetical protein